MNDIALLAMFHPLQLIYAEEGRRGLYAGMSAHLLRVVPNSALIFLTYEVVVHLLTGPA